MERPKNLRSETSRGMVFERRGKGRPVILLHGWCLNRKMWMYTEEVLRKDCEVITPDLPGFGRSDHLAGPYSLARYADELRGLLIECDLHDAVLVGFAFGAAVALELAAQGEARIGGVVSIGVPAAAHSPYERMAKAMKRDWPDFARRSANALFHEKPSEATLSWVEGMFASAPLTTALETVDALAKYDDPPGVAVKVSVPALFIHAQNDTVAPASIGEACAGRASKGRLEIIPDCGHFIVIDRKDAFHDVLQDFVKQT